MEEGDARALSTFGVHSFGNCNVMDVGSGCVAQRSFQGAPESIQHRGCTARSKMETSQNDDLGLMKEYDFISIIHKISMIGKNARDELHQCLKRRNGCGHPNSLKLGASTVASHLEFLILNVFQKF